MEIVGDKEQHAKHQTTHRMGTVSVSCDLDGILQCCLSGTVQLKLVFLFHPHSWASMAASHQIALGKHWLSQVIWPICVQALGDSLLLL